MIAVAGSVIALTSVSPNAGSAASVAAPPVLAKTFRALRVSGRVFVAPPGRARTPLLVAQLVPVGSILDAQHGTVGVVSATTRTGVTQSADLSGGVFQVLQSVSEGGLTELRLTGGSFKGCGRTGRAAARRSIPPRVVRLLRATAHGSFRTRGRYSAATVRGTQWDTVDRCDGTLTRVKRGLVVVRDFRTGRDNLIKQGQSYIAHASGSIPAVPAGEARMTRCPPDDPLNPFPSNTPFTFVGEVPGAPAGTRLRIEYIDPNAPAAIVETHVTTDAHGVFTDTHAFPASSGGFAYGAGVTPRYPDDPLAPGQGCSFVVQ